MSRLRTFIVISSSIWFLVAAAGCVGQIGSGVGFGDDDDGSQVDPDEPRQVCESGQADIAGPRLLRRLTSVEYTASVRDALDLSAAAWPGAALPADAAGRNGFTNNADRLAVDDAYAEGLLATSKQVADAVIQPAQLAAVLPCSGGGGADCARAYLATVGRRLYRRPLTDAETARYLSLHDTITAEDDFATWVYWATVGLLQSPNFVYRSELGEPDGAGYRLTGYEIATALAFDLTGHPPDDALLDLAASGAFDDPAQIAAAARNLAIDPASGEVRPAFKQVFLKFNDQWLGLSSLANLSAKTDPAFTEAVRASMQRETEDFVSNVVFVERGGLRELLTSPTTLLDANLAAYYGFGGAGASERPAGWGVGLLAQGSLLAINAGNEWTSPTKRGLLVRKKFLCYDMPPPPPFVGDLPQPTGLETTRQRYEDIHAANASCAGCHAMMDPMGFAFEHLDAMGRYRADEHGLPIDDSGYLRGLGATDITFTGPQELAETLAARPETSTCMASYMASYAYGLDHHDTPCLVTSLAESFQSGDVSIVDFYLRLTATTHFTRRVDE